MKNKGKAYINEHEIIVRFAPQLIYYPLVFS